MVTYRTAKKEDVEELVRVRSIFLTEYDGKEYIKNRNKIDKEIEEYLRRYIETKKFTAFIAEKDGKTAGTSAVVFHDILPAAYYSNGKLGYISNVFVFNEYRKQGIAKRLFELVMNEALSRDCSKITLHASKTGEEVYKKFGFVKTTTEMEYVNKKFL